MANLGQVFHLLLDLFHGSEDGLLSVCGAKKLRVSRKHRLKMRKEPQFLQLFGMKD